MIWVWVKLRLFDIFTPQSVFMRVSVIFRADNMMSLMTILFYAAKYDFKPHEYWLI